MTDSNGNQIVLQPHMGFPAGVDTMGRETTMWGTATQSTTDATGCASTLPFAMSYAIIDFMVLILLK